MTDLMECPGPCADGEVCWCAEKADLSFGTVQRLMEKLKRSHPNLHDSSAEALWCIAEALIEAACEVVDHIYEDEFLGSSWEKRFEATWQLQRWVVRQLHTIHAGRFPRELLPPESPTATIGPHSKQTNP